MKNKRTKKSAVMACGLAALIAISGAFAFMSDHDNAINKFSFTSDDGAQSIDIQLIEENWDEASGESIQYGTPVQKDPKAKNIGEKDMYAFATVILPAKGVAVQNKLGQYVDVDGMPITGSDFTAMFDTKIVSNITPADNAASTVDQTEILGVFKDAALTEEYDYGEELASTVYFKLNSTAAVSTFPAANLTTVAGTPAVEDDPSTDENEAADAVPGYYILQDTVDQDNYTSDILGHQFMLKVVPKAGTTLDVRELFTLELDDSGSADRIIDGAWVHYDDVPTAEAADAGEPYASAAGEVAGSAAALDVYGRSTYNDAKWVEITDEIDNPTVYIDGAGRIYSAHVFYWTEALAPDAETDTIFDWVEFLNVAPGQIFDEDDLNIYVETYGVQVTGTEDALTGVSGDVAEGAALWAVMTNSENQEGFDIFGVVKDTQDDELTALAADSKTVANDYGRAIVNP